MKVDEILESILRFTNIDDLKAIRERVDYMEKLLIENKDLFIILDELQRLYYSDNGKYRYSVEHAVTSILAFEKYIPYAKLESENLIRTRVPIDDVDCYDKLGICYVVEEVKQQLVVYFEKSQYRECCELVLQTLLQNNVRV